MHGFVDIGISDVFGVVCVFVSLCDEAGTVLEKGYAWCDEDLQGYWFYFPQITLPVGMPVTVRAVARDSLGAMGMAQEKVTVLDHNPTP